MGRGSDKADTSNFRKRMIHAFNFARLLQTASRRRGRSRSVNPTEIKIDPTKPPVFEKKKNYAWRRAAPLNPT
jgi:hypothetical protein